MLRQLNQYLARPVTPDEIVSGFAGARPLVGSEGDVDTKKLARDDVIEVDAASGLISIMGGKWTTHRAMGEDTISRVQEALGVTPTESQTRNHVLYGGEGFTDDYREKLAHQHGLSEATARHLTAKFGTAAEKVLSVARENPVLLKPLIPSFPAIGVEVVYAIRNEMAATIEDVLARRVGMQLHSWRDAIEAAPVVGSLMAAELRWDDAQEGEAVQQYVGKINHLLDSAGLSRNRPPAKADASAKGSSTGSAAD
jgi:glycerol-3-phosphate dehydrogenase